MISFGHACLLAALVASAWALVTGALAGVTGSERLSRSAGRGLYASFGLVSGATVAVLWALGTDRFDLAYVASVSRQEQPLPYKLAALWGGLEGSLVLWAFILAGFAAAVVWLGRERDRVLMPWVQATLAFVLQFFLALIAFVENPFTFVTAPVAPPDGSGMNPLLQNFWMLIHPPCLYLGFVGMTVPFAYAVAALITGQLGDVWIRVTRRWTILGWLFLGFGVFLGSYWSYLELGWGGYWFWDPVENASFMPWLVITAFLHSVMMQEKRDMLKVWNVLLIILAFCLSIFGTLLTRSDILSSVHNFAGSRVGPHFGLFLALTLTGSLLLVIWRLPLLRSRHRIESLLSREAAFLVNNLLFVGICAGIFYLTMYPVFSTLLTGSRVSMGAGIFNLVLSPWFLVLVLLMGIGPVIAWRRSSARSLRVAFTGPTLALIVTLVFIFGATRSSMLPGLRSAGARIGETLRGRGFDAMREAFDAAMPLLGALFMASCVFVTATIAQEFIRGTRARMTSQGEALHTAFGRLTWRNKRRYGGYLVHLGIVLIVVGITGSSVYQKIQRFEPVVPGQSLSLDGYEVRYEGLELNGHRGRSWSALGRANGLAAGAPEDPRQAWEWGWVHWFDEFYYPRDAIAWDQGTGNFSSAAEAAQQGFVFHNGFFYPFEGNHRAFASVVSVRRDGREIARGLAPQRRVYGWNPQPTTEVAIVPTFLPRGLRDLKRIGEDLYIIPNFIDPITHQVVFELKVRPFVNWFWLGGVIFLIGGLIGIVPDPRESARLARLAKLEERAVA